MQLVVAKTLEEAAQDADLVVEAIFEDLEAKQSIFNQLDALPLDVLPAHGELHESANV